MPSNSYHCLALYSSGLDSLLACKLMQSQGLRVLGLHFTSPFFGSKEKIPHWEQIHNLDLLPVDIGQEYVDLLTRGPAWGFGKYLNPCIDCKILMLKKAAAMLPMFEARFLISGEVLGQRPMSQRRDAMNIIRREAGVKETLLRPLSGRKLSIPPAVSESNLVDLDRLPAIQGRGRKEQLRLAREFQIQEVPTPAGGCLLADPESSRRFSPLLVHMAPPRVEDFELAKVGRQYWSGDNWLVIGRNQEDNTRLMELVQKDDIVFKLADLPGPLALGRQPARKWSRELIIEAARFMSTFSTKAQKTKNPARIKVGVDEQVEIISVDPAQSAESSWQEPRMEVIR
ncbi:MAG: tRNA(5-methylaminomethyl-2-thiouridylate) methyltransferase [Desulfohalobiaceae bacterium]|nr:tRNA(5-methylaminomethyl-2-thiouridylate) methyltransferase [Desulfohalobiaceae bacterium]